MKNAACISRMQWVLFTIFFFGLLAPQVSRAQKANIDSLRQVLQEETDPEKRFKLYYDISAGAYLYDNELADRYVDSALLTAIALKQDNKTWRAYTLKAILAGEFDKHEQALKYYQEALKTVRNMKRADYEIVVLSNIASVYYDRGLLSDALQYYLESREKLVVDSTLDLKKTRVALHDNIGIIYKNQYRLEDALREYKEGADLAAQYGFRDKQWRFYEGIALVYGRMGNIKSKLDYLKRALALIPEGHNYTTTVWNNLGNTYAILNKPDSAIYFHRKVLDFPKTIPKSKVHAYNGMAKSLQSKKLHADAIQWAGKALTLGEQLKDTISISQAKLHMGKALCSLKRYEEATDVLQSALSILESNHNYKATEELSTIRYYLAFATAHLKKDPELAGLIEEFSRGRDSMHQENILRTVEEFRAKYETRQKEDSIRILTAEQQLQSAKTARYQMGFFGGVLLAGLLGFLLFFIIRKRRLEKTMYEEQFHLLRYENQSLLDRIQSIDTSNDPRSLLDFADDTIVLNGSDKQVFRIGDILYFESQGNGIQVVTLDGRHWRWQTMKNLESVLPCPPFIKVHRSYLVNGMHIRQYKASRFTLSDGSQIKIGVTLQPEADAFLRRWLPELA